VRELLGRLSSAEIGEWLAYYELEPFGEWRADLRAGIIASTVFNMNRGEHAAPARAADFMPDFSGERLRAQEKSIEELKLLASMVPGIRLKKAGEA
jgi:Protein of unknown function (DUF4035)